jgi:hypothetical protein
MLISYIIYSFLFLVLILLFIILYKINTCESKPGNVEDLKQIKVLDRILTLNSIDGGGLLSVDDPREGYKKGGGDRGSSRGLIHWGQRKLFLTELWFLMEYGKLSDNIVYAGSAPGTHIPYLSFLFPKYNWYLVDPNPFFIEIPDDQYFWGPRDYADRNVLNKYNEEQRKHIESKITILQTYMDDSIAYYFYLLGSCLLMSDIRREHEEEIVIDDNNMQKEWLQQALPKKSLLKFRCPYGTYKEKFFKYLNGDVLLQPWAPMSSTETRLIPFDNFNTTSWDNLKYEEQLFYFNNHKRPQYDYDFEKELLDKYNKEFNNQPGHILTSDSLSNYIAYGRTLQQGNIKKPKFHQAHHMNVKPLEESTKTNSTNTDSLNINKSKTQSQSTKTDSTKNIKGGGSGTVLEHQLKNASALRSLYSYDGFNEQELQYINRLDNPRKLDEIITSYDDIAKLNLPKDRLIAYTTTTYTSFSWRESILALHVFLEKYHTEEKIVIVDCVNPVGTKKYLEEKGCDFDLYTLDESTRKLFGMEVWTDSNVQKYEDLLTDSENRRPILLIIYAQSKLWSKHMKESTTLENLDDAIYKSNIVQIEYVSALCKKLKPKAVLSHCVVSSTTPEDKDSYNIISLDNEETFLPWQSFSRYWTMGTSFNVKIVPERKIGLHPNDGDYPYRKFFKEHVRYQINDELLLSLREINSYCECQDCMLECKIFNFDLEKIKEFNKIVNLSLQKGYHGYFTGKDTNEIRRLIDLNVMKGIIKKDIEGPNKFTMLSAKDDEIIQTIIDRKILPALVHKTHLYSGVMHNFERVNIEFSTESKAKATNAVCKAFLRRYTDKEFLNVISNLSNNLPNNLSSEDFVEEQKSINTRQIILYFIGNKHAFDSCVEYLDISEKEYFKDIPDFLANVPIIPLDKVGIIICTVKNIFAQEKYEWQEVTSLETYIMDNKDNLYSCLIRRNFPYPKYFSSYVELEGIRLIGPCNEQWKVINKKHMNAGVIRYGCEQFFSEEHIIDLLFLKYPNYNNALINFYDNASKVIDS